jgi:hypothetical protein
MEGWNMSPEQIDHLKKWIDAGLIVSFGLIAVSIGTRPGNLFYGIAALVTVAAAIYDLARRSKRTV